ncbi:MAG TPA: 4Fe-4S dicluster domain-containing protein [Symbiobacteriaceae bacterium]|nr:4Fe-4S dicluster domain-containing protein [Symbiobacteriaceae bacterium]
MTLAFVQDMSLCMECQGCRVACQTQNGLPAEQTFVRLRFHDSGTYPRAQHHVARITCQHCLKPTCVSHCPTGATYVGESGLVHFNADKCIGCGWCEKRCPFEVPKVVQGKALRCTGCESLTEYGKEPACVSTCISGALAFGPREEMLQRAEARVAALKVRHPNAQVYSPKSVGGTGLIWVLRDKPEVYGLPLNPRVRPTLSLHDMVQPGTQVSAAGGVLLAGLGWIIARRMQLSETKGGEE